MKKITYLLSFFALVFSTQTIAQYGCSSGVVITDGYTATGITSPGTGGAEDWNDNPTVECGGTSAFYWDDDVYLFTYTAGATDEEISMTTFSRNSWNGLGIFTTCTGTALDGCLDTAGTTGTNATKTVTANISAGQTVYIAVGQWGSPNDLDFDVTAFSVTPLVNPPSCTTLSSPLNGATEASTSGDISWNAASGAPTDYLLEVGTTSGGSEVFSGQVGNVTTYNVGTLSGNTTYYVTITPSNSNGAASGCTEESFTTFVPAPNDECENAIGLTVNSDLACGSVTAGSNVNSTASAQADDVTGTPNTDVWYSFVATAESHQVVLSNVVYVSGGTFSSTDMGMGVYDATSGCGALTFVDDSDPNTLFLSGLTIGNTYLVRVYNWSSTIFYNTFDICVGTPPSAPENDDCSGAVSLTVNEDLNCTEVTNGTIASATNSGVDTCGGTEDDDVWYSFVATSETHTVSLLNITGGTTDLYHAVYDADPGCGALGTALTCSDPNNSSTSGLIVGNTYYVQVYSWTSTAGQTSVFDICIGTPPPPPANDNCATAEALTVNTDGTCTITTSGTLEFSTESSVDPSCDAGTEWDVWYSFVAPSSGNVDFTVTLGTGNPLEYAVFDDCAGTTELYCSDPLNGTSLTGLTPGTTYYLMVWNDGFETPGDFTICASEPTCTPSTATYTIVNDCDNSGGFLIDVEITDMGSATNLTVSNDQDAITFPVTTTGTIVQFGPYTNGTNVVITVSDDSDSNCSYDSSTLTQVACPPSNDDIANATAITIGEMICDGSTNNGTNVAATDSGEGAGSCFVGGAGSDVWYTFTISTDSDVTISTDYLGGTLVDTQIAVYSGTPGALVEEACSQDEGVVTLSNGFSWNSIIPDLTLITGTYYVQVSGYNGAEGTFCLSVDAVSLSTEDFDKEAAFTYYPNPVNNNLNLSSQKEINNVSVYNMVGQEVYRSTPNTMTDVVDMSGLQAGAYFVKVTVGNATKTVKVIKN